jgi:ribonuclease D
MKIIKSNNELQMLCQLLKDKAYVIMDTEFCRRKTYFPVLSLIQIAHQHEAFVIDCLAPNFDIKILEVILFNANILKVFHGCKQDLEIIFHKFAKVPYPIFDTQIAAGICELGPELSLSKLAVQFLGIEIDKTTRYSNWLVRPLTEEQIRYAFCDVIHLQNIYQGIAALINTKEKQQLMNIAIDGLSKKDNFIHKPENAWLKVKGIKKNKAHLAAIKKLAAWRELKARVVDLPRTHLLKDEALIAIAKNNPLSLKELKAIKQIGENVFAYNVEQELMSVLVENLRQD